MQIQKKIGIVFAMQEELDVVMQYLDSHELLKVSHCFVTHTAFQQKKLYLINAGIGKVNAAIATSLLIREYKPDLIINVGIAGAVTKKLTAGDVILSDTSVYYDVDATVFGYQHGQIPRMPTHYKSNLSAFNHDICLEFKLLRGVLCTGDSFLTSKHRLRQIRKFFQDILAIDMEGAAIAQTCYLLNVPFLMIKGISDQVDKASTQDSEKNVKLAMEHAAKTLLIALENLEI